MKKEEIYWTEPQIKGDKKTWEVTKMNGEKKVVGTQEFKSKQDAWGFLRTINIYINDTLMFSGE
jgi:hypothetical protein